MKKVILSLVGLLLMAKGVFAIYVTPGNYKSWTLDSLVVYSNGHITHSNGIYYFNDTLVVSQSDTIKILSNTTIKMALKGFINVYGTFIINPPDSVKVTAIDTTQKFIGFKLDSLSDASVFKRLIMEYGNSIYLMYCDMLIDSCTLRYNYYYTSGLRSGTIYLFFSSPTISNNKIFRNIRAAIASGANVSSSPKIINNLIYENDLENYNTPQINLGAASSLPIIIRGNIIRGGLATNSGGISVLPVGTVPFILIENNIIKNNRYGIALQGSNINAYIVNNIIDSNNIQGLPLLGGSGLNFNGTSTLQAIVSRNKIRWNLWGITIQNTAKPNLGNLTTPDTTDIGLNWIYGNSHNDTIFDLYNNTPDSIWAQNNWWGTTIVDSIESHIFHKPDNPSLGFVNYIPFRITTDIYSGLYQKSMLGYKLFEAFPNPFNITTTISFELYEKGYVSLYIFDVTGRKLHTLVNGQQLLPGLHRYLFNAEQLAGGVYFVNFLFNNHSTTKKLVLLK
ncbi:MAG: T9SS type A sorting domain-containing protein [Ignavibacteria bacterium]